jgi:general secretion pathway protein L
MSEHLIIRLRAARDEHVSWVVMTPQGRRVGDIGRGTLAEAGAFAPGRRVVALLPGTDIMLCETSMPIRNQARLLKALPYSLEDHLAEDVEGLHFAASRPDAGGRVRAAVVDQSLMRDMQRLFAEAGLQVDAVYADSEAVPLNPGSLTLLLDGARIYLAPPVGLPQVFDGLTLVQVLSIVCPDGLPNHLLVYCEAHHDRHLADYWSELRDQGVGVDVHLQPEGGISRLAAGIIAQPGINLLQGEFAARRSHWALWQQWRIAAMMLAAFGLVVILGKVVEVQRLAAEVSALDDEIQATFQRSFGNIPVSDYRAQTRAQLARLGAGPRPDAELIAGLDALGRSLAQAGGNTEVLALSYRRGVLDLRVRAPDVATLDRLQRGLTEAGAGQAEIQVANPVDGGAVEGRLQVRHGSGA